MEKKAEKVVSKGEKFDNVKYWIEHGVDIEKRRISLVGAIDEDTFRIVKRAIRRMVDSNTNDIYLDISSFGGDIYYGFALYDVLRACKGVNIYTTAEGPVMSAGILVYLAGDYRRAAPNVKFMIHEVSVEDISELRAHQFKVEGKELESINKDMAEIISEYTKHTPETWLKMMEKDIYLKKGDALKKGLVTEGEYAIE